MRTLPYIVTIINIGMPALKLAVEADPLDPIFDSDEVIEVKNKLLASFKKNSQRAQGMWHGHRGAYFMFNRTELLGESKVGEKLKYTIKELVMSGFLTAESADSAFETIDLFLNLKLDLESEPESDDLHNEYNISRPQI